MAAGTAAHVGVWAAPGALATFHLQVLYRRNSSWQGKLAWTEQDQAQSFRSVLELITLIESGVQG